MADPLQRHLQDLYADLPGGGEASERDRALVDGTAGPGASTYGELTTEGALRVIRWLRLTPADRFIDLGSGTGRIPILAALASDVGRAVGVELSGERHDVAARARARLPESIAARIELRHEDLGRTELVGITAAFAGSLAFPEPLMTTLEHRLSEVPDLRALLTLKRLRREPDAWFDVPTTWAERTRVFVYR